MAHKTNSAWSEPRYRRNDWFIGQKRRSFAVYMKNILYMRRVKILINIKSRRYTLKFTARKPLVIIRLGRDLQATFNLCSFRSHT